MNGVCQSCGTIAPIEWFLSDADHRQICAVVAELPRDVAPLVFHYLALFKPESGKAMQPRKALRLVTELKLLVTAGHVQYDRKAARPCPHHLWARAMEQMIERRDRLNLPMPNHRYLITIAWDLAEADDRARESAPQQRSARTNDGLQRVAAVLNPLDQWIQGKRDDKPSDEEMDAWKKSRLQNL